MTPLKFVNVFLFQLFFVRLTKCTDNETNESWYAIQGFIVPFTGWYGDFMFLGNKWFINFK